MSLNAMLRCLFALHLGQWAKVTKVADLKWEHIREHGCRSNLLSNKKVRDAIRGELFSFFVNCSSSLRL